MSKSYYGFMMDRRNTKLWVARHGGVSRGADLRDIENQRHFSGMTRMTYVLLSTSTLLKFKSTFFFQKEDRFRVEWREVRLWNNPSMVPSKQAQVSAGQCLSPRGEEGIKYFI
jgi:hypothetical protein